MNRIKIFEGPDGCGKTTAAKHYAKVHDGVYIHNPTGTTETHKDLYKFMKDIYHEFDTKAMAMLMLGSWIDMCEWINAEMDNELIVFDRSPISSAIYHGIPVDTILEILYKVSTVGYLYMDMNNVTVLTADIDVLYNRIGKRDGGNSIDDYLTEDMIEKYNGLDVTIVDTTGKTPDEVNEIISGS